MHCFFLQDRYVESIFKVSRVSYHRTIVACMVRTRSRLFKLAVAASPALPRHCAWITGKPEITADDLSAFIRPEGVLDYNRHYINDLPVTSPHGSDFGAMRKILNLQRPEADTWHSSGTP